MNILESLMTPGCLVRFGQQHGMVYSFNKRTNEVRVQLGTNGPTEDVHFSRVRAGSDDTELQVCGIVTKQFPKDPWPEARESGAARTLPHPRTVEIWR